MHERTKESIWETTCKCGAKTRVDLRGQSGDQVVRIGCDDHWFELPAEDLRVALAKVDLEMLDDAKGRRLP